MCDDECPYCGARHASPVDSDDLTVIVVEEGELFAVLVSPNTAEENPNYEQIGKFATAELAARAAEAAESLRYQ
jgi:hypothetical protein